MMIVIGHAGSDAGWIWIDGEGHIHRVPGWEPELINELRSAVAVVREASQIKTAGVAEAAIQAVHGLIAKELGAHVEGGGVVLLT